ncbi:acyl-CoA dehydrogenase family protein [Piscinibacter sakaiensis]|uniref:3-sulfinopropanoyl-CoA desulfinase n=1 Tax=Piscinibacter sakaiensis TaxID=1547922 RepID=A0A0K8P0I8_PISS1|nr:acyl-CoA dehydrogenase family protein [Piscinibacter sakaiensis]GAP35675.1 acyl-CoA dehydrogenase, short-chain specific [Piscinibacter sakaiensis]
MLKLTPEQQALQARARELAQTHFAPKAADVDRTEAYPWESVALLRDAGFLTMTLPTSHGGMGASFQDAVIVIEEVSKACASLGRVVVDATMGAIGMVRRYGTPEQLDLAAGLLRAGDKPAILITEPDTGSAATEMSTRADRDGDHYVLQGDKYWITGGGVSRLHIIYARVFDDGVEQGIGAFLHVRDPAQPDGLVIGERIPAMGIRGIPETHVHLRRLRVHRSMLLATPGGLRRSFASLMKVYNAQRVGAGTVALGIAQGAFEEAVRRVKARRQFGRPLAEFQGLQWMLADMSVQLEAARLLLHAAACSGSDLPDMHSAAQAKTFAGEACFKVCNDALQLFGSSGYGRDQPMERHLRDVRMFTISGGTAQILRTQVASVVLGMKLPQTRTGYAELAGRARD